MTEIYVLRLADRGEILGNFSTLEKAQAHAQEDADEEGDGPITWTEFEGNWTGDTGYGEYWWIQTFTLDPERAEWEGDK